MFLYVSHVPGAEANCIPAAKMVPPHIGSSARISSSSAAARLDNLRMKMDVSSPEESSPEENMARRQGDFLILYQFSKHIPPPKRGLFELSQLAATTEPLDDPPQLPGQDHESTIRRTLHPLARSRLSAASALHPQ